MEALENNWIISIVIAFAVYIVIVVYRKYRDQKEDQSFGAVKDRVTQINLQMLNEGMGFKEIMDFWEECLAEAEIQKQLPPCRCKDVNECDTWCRVKARFVMNPPE